MPITKARLSDSIQNQLGLPKNQSTQAVESILEIIKETLEKGEDVLITGFGKFCLKEKRERRGLFPAHTGKPKHRASMSVRPAATSFSARKPSSIPARDGPASMLPCGKMPLNTGGTTVSSWSGPKCSAPVVILIWGMSSTTALLRRESVSA